jgi:hypothetical protein
MEKLILVGLVEPLDASAVPAFEQWYLGNHVEDTSHCPKIRRGTVYKLAKKFAGPVQSQYLAIYEWEIDDLVEAEKTLMRWQSDPSAFPARLPPNGSLKILGSGWYERALAFETEKG